MAGEEARANFEIAEPLEGEEDPDFFGNAPEEDDDEGETNFPEMETSKMDMQRRASFLKRQEEEKLAKMERKDSLQNNLKSKGSAHKFRLASVGPF